MMTTGARLLGGLAVVALVLGACTGSDRTTTNGSDAPGPPSPSSVPAPTTDPEDFVEIEGIGRTRVDVPRPTSTGAACELATPADETVAERVAALRAIGFFADRAALSDERLAAEVETGILDLYGDGVLSDQSFLDLLVAEQDARRVWWRDLEADVGRGGEVYALTLDEWAVISTGAFTPSDISESWASETGPVTLRFTLDGTHHTLQPAYLEDWIDPTILGPINDLIAASGRRYTLVQAFDQTAYLLAPTPDERTALEARGWCFD